MPTRDLTHSLDADTVVYPGDPEVELTPSATHDEDGYRVTELRFGSHAGTHIDAPSHTEPDGKNLDDFALDEFVFDARVVDCSGSGVREPIGPEKIPTDAEFSDAELLIFRTGWDDYWGTDRYFDHPYLTEETAKACAERGLHVGLDALSPDPSPSEGAPGKMEQEPDGVPAHHQLLGNDLFVLENLTALAGLPERFELRAYPLALAETDGSPVRAIAVW